jgi:hypothetical protein
MVSISAVTVAIDMSLDTTNGIEVQIAIKTPFTDEISLTVSHRGALRKLESHIKAVYDGKKQYDIKAKFSVNKLILPFIPFMVSNLTITMMSSVNGVFNEPFPSMPLVVSKAISNDISFSS